MSQQENKKPFHSDYDITIKTQRPSSTSPESWWGTKTIAMYKGWLIFENISDNIIEQEIDEMSGYDYKSLEKRRQIWSLFKMTDNSTLKKKLFLLKVYIYIKYDPDICDSFMKSLNKKLDSIVSTLDPVMLLCLQEYITESKNDYDEN